MAVVGWEDNNGKQFWHWPLSLRSTGTGRCAGWVGSLGPALKHTHWPLHQWQMIEGHIECKHHGAIAANTDHNYRFVLQTRQPKYMLWWQIFILHLLNCRGLPVAWLSVCARHHQTLGREAETAASVRTNQQPSTAKESVGLKYVKC